MNNQRDIIVRSFIHTGLDDMPGMIRYIDTLERCIIYIHKHMFDKKQALRRIDIDRAMKDIAIEIGYGKRDE